jgi:hypothetical protein
MEMRKSLAIAIVKHSTQIGIGELKMKTTALFMSLLFVAVIVGIGLVATLPTDASADGSGCNNSCWTYACHGTSSCSSGFGTFKDVEWAIVECGEGGYTCLSTLIGCLPGHC